MQMQQPACFNAWHMHGRLPPGGTRGNLHSRVKKQAFLDSFFVRFVRLDLRLY